MSDPPASSLLDANLAALDAALAALVRSGSGGRWLRTAAVEGPVLQLRTAAGALVAAHSRRPDTEAARIVDDALAGRPHPGVAIVIGAGLGYVLDDLLSRDAATRLLVIEPDPSGLAPWLERRDWRDAIARGRLAVLAGPDYRGSEQAWRVVVPADRAPLVIVHPVLAREYPDDVRRAGAVGARVVADARANAGAEAVLAGPYLLNTIENLGVIAREADVEALHGAFAGMPAIVVAAGPSLDRSVEEVARLADRALVVAVDTALRPLLAQGVVPHLAVAVDPSDRNARHLTALPDAGATWFVAEPSVHPRAFPAFAGRTFTFCVGPNQPWPWLAAAGVTRGTLAAWGSVLVSALDLAVRAGAGPIAIVGADLAYTGGQPYCRGTAFEEDWAREVFWGSRLADVWDRVASRPGAQTLPGVDGRAVPTLPHLVAFRDRLLAQAAASGVRIVNATVGGILHGRGIEVAPLADAIAGAPIQPDLRARLRERHRASAAAARASAGVLPGLLGRADAPRAFAAMLPDVDGDAIVTSVARAREALAAPPIGTPLTAPSAVPVPGSPVWLPEQAAALASLVDAGAIARAPLPADATAIDAEAAFLAVLDAARALLGHPSLVTAAPDAGALQRELLGMPLPTLLAFVHDARADAERLGAALTRWLAAAALARPADAGLPAVAAPPAIGPTEPLARGADALGRLAVVTTLAWAAARRGRADAVTGRAAEAIARSWERTTTEAPRATRVRLALDMGGKAMIWLEDGPLAPLAGALTGTLVRAGTSPSPAGPAGGGTMGLAGSLALETGGEWRDAGVLLPWMPAGPAISMTDGGGHASQASHGGWTADVVPGAHLVRVADGRGTRGWVICASPQGVAWIEGALVVAADGGLVVQVVDVVDRLG